MWWLFLKLANLKEFSVTLNKIDHPRIGYQTLVSSQDVKNSCLIRVNINF